MKKFGNLLLALLFAVLLLAGCADSNQPADNNGATSINLLARGWINIPTDENDPYKKWILDNYQLDVNYSTSSDVINSAQIAFSSQNNKPDLIAFPDLQSFSKIESQGVLVDDWTPYLEKMPKMKAFINSEDQKFLKSLFTDENGKLRALWTPPNATTWSLKIREDWANEYRSETEPSSLIVDGSPYYPAGATATDGGPWQPKTEKDLLHFARWIKMNKNADPSNPDCFGFTTSGSGRDFGTMGDWLPMMWGYVSTPPYGIYVDPATNKASFTAVDGTLGPALDYMRMLVDEQLIDPNWFNQTPSQDTRTKAGKIGMTWYTNVISEMTANYNPNLDTVGWWKTYDIPKAVDSSPIGGIMLTDSVASSIITVSAKAAINPDKMDKICKLLDDIVTYVDDTKEGADRYVRGVAYDALKWGIGVEDSLVFQPIEGTPYQYICVKTGETYRESGAGVGAWDWGAWFSTTNDGIIQGESQTISPIVLESVAHDMATGSYDKVLQVGSFLKLDTLTINNMTTSLNKYKYDYIMRKPGTLSLEQFEYYWRTSLKGDEILEEATEQFKALGFIKE